MRAVDGKSFLPLDARARKGIRDGGEGDADRRAEVAVELLELDHLLGMTALEWHGRSPDDEHGQLERVCLPEDARGVGDRFLRRDSPSFSSRTASFAPNEKTRP